MLLGQWIPNVSLYENGLYYHFSSMSNIPSKDRWSWFSTTASPLWLLVIFVFVLTLLILVLSTNYTSSLIRVAVDFPLTSLCHVSVNLSKHIFLIICHKNVISHLLILSMCFHFSSALHLSTSLITCSSHDITL